MSYEGFEGVMSGIEMLCLKRSGGSCRAAASLVTSEKIRICMLDENVCLFIVDRGNMKRQEVEEGLHSSGRFSLYCMASG